MPSVNLAPGTQQIVAARRRRRRLLLLTALVLLAVGMAWGGLLWYEQSLNQDHAALQDRLRTVQTEIARLSTSAERVQLFENRLAVLGGLLNQHVRWEPLLQNIERLLPPSVTITALTIDATLGEVSLQGFTTDTDQVAQALASLLSDKTQTVFTDGTYSSIQQKVVAGAEEGAPAQVQYEFGITLSFNPSILTNTP